MAMVITRRIRTTTEVGLLSKAEAGFRVNRSVIDQIFTLS